MTSQTQECCREYGASRRGFLKGAMAVAGAGLVTAVHGEVFSQTAFAATGKADSVLVVLSLRGGADGLSLVVPHGDPGYATARPKIAVPSSQLLVKDELFGLHPRLAPLVPMWKAGQIAAVQATGLHSPNRSHFAAMEEVEDADPGSSARRGWLNRLIGLDRDNSPLQGVQVGEPIVPTSMYGPQQVLATTDVESVELAGPSDAEGHRRRLASLNTTWGHARGPLGRNGRASMRTVDDFRPARSVAARPQHGAAYPTGDLGAALSQAARVIRADVGAEVITVDFGGWDMHTNVGNLEHGAMRDQAAEMAQAIAAFFTDLGGLGSRVTLVTISEFGRRVAENASQGLDHGYGNVMLLAGAGVRGGKFYAQWPGLGSGSMVDGDLAVTTDYRSVLSEVLRSRFNADISKVFPGFTGERVGAMALR